MRSPGIEEITHCLGYAGSRSSMRSRCRYVRHPGPRTRVNAIPRVSGGMRQRVMIAMHDREPAVLIADDNYGARLDASSDPLADKTLKEYTGTASLDHARPGSSPQTDEIVGVPARFSSGLPPPSVRRPGNPTQGARIGADPTRNRVALQIRALPYPPTCLQVPSHRYAITSRPPGRNSALVSLNSAPAWSLRRRGYGSPAGA